MNKSCLDHDILPKFRCIGCVTIRYGIDNAPTAERKEIVKLRKRAKRNVCFQPWRAEHSNGRRSIRQQRENILIKYPHLGDLIISTNEIKIDKFNKVKKISGK